MLTFDVYYVTRNSSSSYVRTIVGNVIATGNAPPKLDWIRQGVTTALSVAAVSSVQCLCLCRPRYGVVCVTMGQALYLDSGSQIKGPPTSLISWIYYQ